MKKCPKCHADIADNARFCVFCMSPLQKKETVIIKEQFDKRWLYILAAFLLVAAISFFAILSGNKDNNDNDSNISSLSESTISSHSDNSGANNPDISNNNSSNDNNINDSTDNKTPTITPNNTKDPVISDNPSVPNDPTTPSTPSQDDTNKKTESNTDIDNDTPNTPEATKPTYSYRDALYTECYMYDNQPQNLYMENHIVITGVYGVAGDGVYEIPETINGKKVVAVMQSAFSDPSVSANVKKIILPSTVRSVWENAFSDCYNLTDIYFRSKSISVSQLAFADISKRTSTLTIHCSSDCKDAKFFYYKTIASTKYNAVYQLWDGGEI